MRDNQILVHLLPGFWQSRLELAWAYARLGKYEEGLEAVGLSKELAARAGITPDTSVLHYVRALALQGLGRIDEAIAEADQSNQIRPTTLTRELLQQLRAGRAPQAS